MISLLNTSQNLDASDEPSAGGNCTKQQGSAAAVADLLRNKVNLPGGIENLAATFRDAKPFRHLVIDNLFPEHLLDRLISELPRMTDDKWLHQEDKHLIKYNLRSAVDLGEVGSELTGFLHSALFLYFLSEITGIWNLLPDPYLQGAGYHVLPTGGHFDIHVDRNTAYDLGLTRRLAFIVYLNKFWKHKYGGQLELWNSDATRCEAVVEPLFNRTVIFEITDQNYHGVPNPIACPDGRGRASFVTYYHTASDATRKDVLPHNSLYAPSFYREKTSTVRKLATNVMPPIFIRGLRRLMRAVKKPSMS